MLDEVTMHERSIGFQVNQQRNEIIRMNLKLSVLTYGFAGGALYASIFGMNLQSYLEMHPHAFWPVAVSVGVAFPLMVWRHFKAFLKTKHINI